MFTVGAASGHGGVPCKTNGLLAFFAGQAGSRDVYVVRSDGRGLKRLTTSAARESSLSWSADGRVLAFAAHRTIQQRFTTYDGDVYVARSDGGDLRQVTRGAQNDSYPMVSPDGRRMVFVRGPARSPTADNIDYRAAIFVVGTDGRGLRRPTTVPGSYSSPTWSPDGTRIAFLYGDQYALYVVNADGSGTRAVT